jgi:hypothetical protein
MTRQRGGHEKRLQKNDESLNKATHHREAWSADEIAFLMDWDQSDDELSIIAECLGRTREACRERFYKVRRGEAPAPLGHKPTTITRGIGDNQETVRYLGHGDDDDQWWSPDYYIKEK